MKANTRITGYFIPAIPLDWLQPDRLSNGSVKVALCLWYFSALKKQKEDLPFTHKRAGSFGIGIKQMQRSLTELEQAGLIKVSRAVGRSPRVTILSGD